MTQTDLRGFNSKQSKTFSTAGATIRIALLAGALAALPGLASAATGVKGDNPEITDSSSTSTCNGTGTSCTWMGYSWNTQNSDCGVGGGNLCNNVANETVDANGYMHLKIAQVNGKWRDAEIWTKHNFGFGTFNIVIQADPSIFTYNHGTTSWNQDTCFSPFLYGPLNNIGEEGQNEIDFAEFTSWDTPTLQNLDFTVYPAIGSGGDNGYDHVKRWVVPSNPALVTVRAIWSASQVTMTLFDGAVPLGQTGNVIVSNTYAPSNSSEKIPQKALPMVLNLYPSSLKTGFVEQEVIVRSFTYQAQ
jgi:hypothetical protein